MKQEQKQPNRTKIDLAVDATIFAAFLVATAPRFSGLAIHEWLGISFGGGIITHLLLHWQWIAGTTRRFFDKATGPARINYLLNALLFVDITVVIFTGLMISRVAMPSVGIQLSVAGFWRPLHSLSANLSLVLLGLHIALHWNWIVNVVKRYLVAPLLARQPAPQLELVTEPVQEEA